MIIEGDLTELLGRRRRRKFWDTAKYFTLPTATIAIIQARRQAAAKRRAQRQAAAIAAAQAIQRQQQQQTTTAAAPAAPAAPIPGQSAVVSAAAQAVENRSNQAPGPASDREEIPEQVPQDTEQATEQDNEQEQPEQSDEQEATETEAMGIFGLEWKRKIADAMGIKYNLFSQGKAETYIEKLQAAYENGITRKKLSKDDISGLSAYIASATLEKPETIQFFMRKLKELATTKQISFALYDPSQKASKKLFDFGGGIVNKAIIAAAVVGGGYLLVPQIAKQFIKKRS